MAASMTVHLQTFKRPQLIRSSTNLDETGIRIHRIKILYYIGIIKIFHIKHCYHQGCRPF